MSYLTGNGMGHLLYLPKQYLMPCQSPQQSKMRHIPSHSWLNYNWRTKAATDDLHHHRSMQVKRNDHTFSSKNCMEAKVHSTKTKIWASFHIPGKWRHSKMNEQSGFNAEQIEEDTYLESKPIWRINLNNKWTQQNKNHLINKINELWQEKITYLSKFSTLFKKLTTHVTSQALNWEIIFFL
jgi:hypothetical protein